MSLQSKLTQAKKQLSTATRILVFFDDDVDGLCSYLQLHHTFTISKAVAVKSSPTVEGNYVNYVTKFEPDLVVILDKPNISDEFLELIHTPIIWIDHHEFQDKKQHNLLYINPKEFDKTNTQSSTSELVYTIANKYQWIALCGAVSDWQIPKYYSAFAKKNKYLCEKSCKTAPCVLYNTTFGKLIHILIFNLKGKTTDVKKSMKHLTHITHPDQLLTDTNEHSTFLLKRYEQIKKEYDALRDAILQSATDSPVLVYTYNTNTTSLTKEVSNEILATFPEKLTVIARLSSNEYKCSLRNSGNIAIPPLLEKALLGITGYGGGHEHACGACVAEDQFELFIEQLEDAYREAMEK